MLFEPVTGKNVIAYLRVSTKEQGKKGNGLADQREYVNFLVERGQHKLIEIIEEVESAGSMHNRPKLEALVERVAANSDLWIIVAKVDRLVRNQLDGHTILDRVSKRIIFGDIPVAEPMAVAIRLADAEREKDWIGWRTKQGVAQARKKKPNGKWGQPEKMSQEGREKGGDVKRTQAARNPNNIRAYRHMKSLREGGKVWRVIAQELNRDHFRTSRGNKFSAGSAEALYVRMKGNEDKGLLEMYEFENEDIKNRIKKNLAS